LQDRLSDVSIPFANWTIQQEGEFPISKPLRLLNQVGLSGIGDDTSIVPDYDAGPIIMLGPMRGAFPHAAAVLDGADFSFNILKDADPYYFLAPGRPCFDPREQLAFFWELPAVFVGAPSFGTQFISISGGMGSEFSPFYNELQQGSMYVQWAFDLERLLVSVVIGGVRHDILTTSTFHLDLGTRHMIALDYSDVRGTVLLFIDGIIEGSAAANGEFTPNPWECLTIGGGVGFGFPSFECIIHSTDWHCGGFRWSSNSQHSANYPVDWDVPDLNNNDYLLIRCLNSLESDDLLKVSVLNQGVGWLQVERSDDPAVLSTTDLSLTNLRISGSNLHIGVSVFGTPGIYLSKLFLEGPNGLLCDGNCYLSSIEDLYIKSTGSPRWGFNWTGGVSSIRGIVGSIYPRLGNIIQADVDIEQLTAYGYSHAGNLFVGGSGVVGTLSASDENGSPDSICAVYITSPVGIIKSLNIKNLGVDVIASDTTKPILIDRCVNFDLTISGQCPFLTGLTTPPSSIIAFTEATIVEPLKANIRSVETSVPLVSGAMRHKVIYDGKPLGKFALTNADTTLTAADSVAFTLDGVILTGNHAATLSDQTPGDATSGPIEVQDGTVLVFYTGIWTPGAFEYAIKNHDGSILFTFDATSAVKMSFQYSKVTGDWSVYE